MKKIIRSAEDFEEHSVADDVRSEVYNALADIMYRYQASQKDMDYALNWFNSHFYMDDPNAPYDDEDDFDDYTKL